MELRNSCIHHFPVLSNLTQWKMLFLGAPNCKQINKIVRAMSLLWTKVIMWAINTRPRVSRLRIPKINWMLIGKFSRPMQFYNVVLLGDDVRCVKPSRWRETNASRQKFTIFFSFSVHCIMHCLLYVNIVHSHLHHSATVQCSSSVCRWIALLAVYANNA